MNWRTAVAALIAIVLIALLVLVTRGWMSSAEERLSDAEAAERGTPTRRVAVAQNANESYCTPELRQILRRVLVSCGLLGASGGRGCQPVEARNVATMNGADFNALFLPMRSRGGIVQFERASADLDDADLEMIDRLFGDRRGASYFFVVARASPDGAVDTNRELSRQRAEAIMGHLEAVFHDPQLEHEVGLLWLGEEYAQLDPSFCEWSRSGESAECAPTDLNRSAFVAWIDCRL